VWISYPHAGDENNRTIYLDLEQPDTIKVGVDRVGYSSMYTDKNPSQPIGAPYNSGTVVEVDGGGTDTSEFIVETKEYNLGSNNQAVHLEALVLDLETSGIITVTVEGDTGRSETWVEIVTQGRSRRVRNLPHNFKCNRVKVILESTNQLPTELVSVGFKFTPAGRPSEGVEIGRSR
jgi:hypothetical protein